MRHSECSLTMRWGVLTSLLLWLPLAARGHDEATTKENALLWKPRTQSVAVFKNGLAFFTQQGAARLNDGWCYTSQVPPAAFGTLAIYATDPEQVVDIVGAGAGEIVDFDGHQTEEDEASKRSKLQDWMGLTVRLQFRQSASDREVTGKLLEISGGYAVVHNDSQTVAVPIAGVTRMQLSELPMRVHVSDDEGQPAEEAMLGMAYLRSGLLWIPEYTLKLIDDETAELTLRGTLVNEAEDLVDCDVNFVVGVPHFVHSDLLSPVVVGRALRSIGGALPQQGVPQQVMSQLMNRAAISNNYRNDLASVEPGIAASEGIDEFQSLLGNLPQMESSGSGAFSVYTKQNLTVRRGERAIVTLMTKRIRYGHRYRWDTSDPMEHLLFLENSTDTPWTTGPCLALSASQPLSEDLLKYTPAGGRGELKVTTAINMAHQVSEEETDRELKAHEPRNNEFLDRVTVGGVIKLKSFEKKPVEILITKSIEGRPLTASDDGMIRTAADKLRLVERSGSITWTISLKPGEERMLSYSYERYVSSN